MPKTTAANGANNSTSVASTQFVVRPYYPDAITTLKRALWRIAYRTRRSIVRYIDTKTYAIQRRAERQRIEAQMRPDFQFIYKSNSINW